MDEVENTGNAMSGFSSADIAGAIAKLREHPEIISAVAGALSSSNSSEQVNEDVPNVESSPTPVNFPIEKISEVVTTLAPMLSEIGGKSPIGKEITGSREDHRYALLCALRPYLSRDRREMIDYMLKFGKIGELIKRMK